MAETRSDAELLSLIAGGDVRAVGELYDRYSPTLFPIALRIIRDRSEAEDVLHDAFVAVNERANQYAADRGTVIAWLVTLVRNLQHRPHASSRAPWHPHPRGAAPRAARLGARSGAPHVRRLGAREDPPRARDASRGAATDPRGRVLRGAQLPGDRRARERTARDHQVSRGTRALRPSRCAREGGRRHRRRRRELASDQERRGPTHDDRARRRHSHASASAGPSLYLRLGHADERREGGARHRSRLRRPRRALRARHGRARGARYRLGGHRPPWPRSRAGASRLLHALRRVPRRRARAASPRRRRARRALPKVLFGHSFGGLVAALSALGRPFAVEGPRALGAVLRPRARGSSHQGRSRARSPRASIRSSVFRAASRART